MYAYEVRVPKERVAVIIGQRGAVKRALQQHADLRLHIDSAEGLVTLEGEDSIKLFSALQVIKAIARGFNPDVAQLLLRQDYVLEQLKLNEYAKTKEAMQRLKGRVIGMKGKSRERIENLTECFVSVYGKTVSIIGPSEWANVAKRAVERLLEGQMHATVWKFLERMRRQLKQRELGA
ncbi:RNA-processing protein [Candidatus Woesearchaeota archaeon]|nr:MAG: RNA-processing protein [Candidatus Woesearchaeota archaeon]